MVRCFYDLALSQDTSGVTASIKGRKQIAMIIKKLEFNRKGTNAGMAQVREKKKYKQKKKKQSQIIIEP